ncbi:uncharacterized protein EI90DRAFT_2906032 [Cantharellus anzutake]|uniref:uncharacterized protein n=1 Tax=Cantharellus anzutake TaxID=1750568 RepID=UPI00190711C2|nr:uncharacterized protein EI90DRAFT_2906032 [Cantharellus anzutake]KAF8340421.1 hypothetical protein EI90DRAFT_2906032 [Cantharellus anzutake]
MECQLGTPDEWYDTYVRLCHGDLGTQERHDTMTSFCSIERNGKLRLQWLIPVPGVFHIRMAAVDAIWRIHLRGQDRCENDTFELFKKLRPKDASKLASNPGYRMLNDGIQHLIRAHLTVYWELTTGFQDLSEFAGTEPSWDEIELLAHRIFNEHIAGGDFEDIRGRPNTEHDHRGENRMLFNRDALLYTLLAQATNTGAIGLMKDLLWHWVPMFLACGKHKYATHLSKFLRDLHLVFPLRLASAIENNWLCNPTGSENGFRGVDWWVELNNLYTKVIFCGSGSNRTLTHIINQSSLIELYRSVHVNIADNFAVTRRSTRHTRANMTNTLKDLQEGIRAHVCRTHTQYSAIAMGVPNMLVVGLTELLLSKNQPEDSAEEVEISARIEECDFDAL